MSWSEKLHPRGRGGKFASKGGGAKASGPNEGFNRAERKQRAKNIAAGAKAAGASRGTQKALKRTSKAIDKGKLTWDQNGNMGRTARRKDRKIVAAHNKRTIAAAGRKNAKKK